jgi:hypothetical protein
MKQESRRATVHNYKQQANNRRQRRKGYKKRHRK